MSRKRNVRLNAKEKAKLIMDEAARNKEIYGQYSIQPTKLSVKNGLSAPVLGLFLADKLNPLLVRKNMPTIGILSRSLTQDGGSDEELSEFLDEFEDCVEDEMADTISE